MAKKESSGEVCSGRIETDLIKDAHTKIKEIVESYKEVNLSVSNITEEVKDNWVGMGRNEFDSQYKLLINKIGDFGDTLQDIYEALVEAEKFYEDADDEMRQGYAMS